MELNNIVIPAKGYRILYFDKDLKAGKDHIDFSLDNDGALYLNVKNATGQVVNLDTLTYGVHNYGQSVGRSSDGGSETVLFQKDSFNSSNSEGQKNYTVSVSKDRGVYDTGFALTAACSNPQATIKYTSNGSEPSKTNGSTYTGPITVSKSSVIKFYAYDNDGNSGVLPYTYVLKDNLKNETTVSTRWVYKNSITKEQYGQALSDLPIVSVSGNASALTALSSSYYQSTVEFLGTHTDEDNYVSTGGARKFGNTSTSQYNSGVTLRFKRDYGSKKLKFTFFNLYPEENDQYPVVKKFGKLELKEGQDGPQSDTYNLGYNRYDEQAVMTLAQKMGKFSLHTRLVHYYYNGKYMGVKTLREDFHENSFEEYFGGSSSDYTKVDFKDDAAGRNFATGKVQPGAGDPALWNKIKAAAAKKDFQEFKKYVDIEDFIKCQTLFMFIDNEWEMEGILHNDAYDGKGQKMIMNINDTDGAFFNAKKTGTTATAMGTTGGTYRYKWNSSSTARKGAGGMFGAFSGNSTVATAGNLEFKTLVKDQVLNTIGPAEDDYKGASGAALSVDSVKQVLNHNITLLDNSYRLDAAFMSARSGMYQSWKDYQPKVVSQVDDRVKFSLQSCLKYGMAHTLDPVTIDETFFGGIELENPNSSSETKVYYTTDGSDPMGADGAVSPKALEYSGEKIPSDSEVAVRPFTTNNWGPLSHK